MVHYQGNCDMGDCGRIASRENFCSWKIPPQDEKRVIRMRPFQTCRSGIAEPLVKSMEFVEKCPRYEDKERNRTSVRHTNSPCIRFRAIGFCRQDSFAVREHPFLCDTILFCPLKKVRVGRSRDFAASELPPVGLPFEPFPYVFFAEISEH